MYGLAPAASYKSEIVNMLAIGRGMRWLMESLVRIRA